MTAITTIITTPTLFLKKYDTKAVISIIGKLTDHYTRQKDDHATYSNLTWEQIGEMSRSGLVEIQNHSYDSHSNTGERKGIMQKNGESSAQYAKYLEQDLMKLQKKIKKTAGTAPAVFTYPFGAVSSSSLSLIKELGFKATLSCHEGISTIKKGDPDCLYNIKRYLRTPEKSSSEFFKKSNQTYSSSSYITMASAAGPAVSVRRIVFPRDTQSAP